MATCRNILRALAAAAGVFLCSQAPALASDTLVRGDEKCMACHASVKADAIAGIAMTRHGNKADARTPSCSNCHGGSDKHMTSGGTEKPDRVFKGHAKSSPEAVNGACLGCHESGARNHWAGSKHETEKLACNNCHTVHAPQDKVLSKITQPDVCFACHKTERAATHKISHHPILEGKVACSDCHNPHGSAGPKLLAERSVNDTCYTCHAEKRGPFLWEHAPVTDDQCGASQGARAVAVPAMP